jgi:hypothetical protein
MTLKGQRSNIKNGKTSLRIFSVGLLAVAIALLYITTIGQQSASALVNNFHANGSVSDEGPKLTAGGVVNCDKNDDCSFKHDNFNQQSNPDRTRNKDNVVPK